MAVGLRENDNLLKWAVTLRGSDGAWKGAVAHLHFDFPNDYPNDPPQVVLMTQLPAYHPNVFGGHICLDMIKAPKTCSESKWLPAYTVESMIMQLTGFLISDDNIDQEVYYGDYSDSTRDYSFGRSTHKIDIEASNDRAIAEIQRCPCGMHTLPPEVDTRVVERGHHLREEKEGDDDDSVLRPLCNLLPELLEQVLVAVETQQDLHRFKRALELKSEPTPGSDERRMWEAVRRELQSRWLRCYFMGPLLTADDVVGIGIRSDVVRNGSGVRVKDLVCVTMTGVISRAAFFTHGVRRSLDGGAAFDCWLPLVVNDINERKALLLLPRSIESLLRVDKVAPEDILRAISMLIKSIAVGMVGGSSNVTRVTHKMSDAALQVYCFMHHLLLAAALNDDLLDAARKHVLDFVDGKDSARTKALCPDLGVLLVELLLVPKDVMPWQRFAPVFIRELLARNVMWVQRGLQDKGMTKDADAFVSPESDEGDKWRCKTHLDGSLVGMRMTCLQVVFGRNVARPETAAGAREQLRAIKSSYSNGNGLPPEGIAGSFNSLVCRIMAAGNWVHMMPLLGMGMSPEKAPRAASVFAAMLRQAVVDSEANMYHRRKRGSLKRDKPFCDWVTDPPVIFA